MDESNAEKKVDFSSDPSELTLTPSQRLANQQLIADRYRVIKMIGQGGMGCVYLVEQIFLHKEFALKTMNPGNLSPMTWRRFQKEAQATVALDHPGLIKVHDFGMLDEGQPFFVMDYFGGETLANIIQQKGALSLNRALPIFIQTCYALAHAHDLGIIHRDIKPSNIMVLETDTGEFDVRVVDFGIAKLVNTSSPESIALTRTGEIFGTPYYMSPEQCIGAAIDRRADIYSLGCVMFQVLSGMPPYIGDSALAIMMQHQSESLPKLKEASLGKTFPDTIDTVIRKMVEKNPDARYQNLIEVAKDLELIKAGQKVIVPEPTRESQPTLNKKDNRWLELGIVSLVCIAGGFLVGRLSAVERGFPSQTSPPTAQTPGNATQQPITPAYKGEYFSASGTKNRLFHFPAPTEQALGILRFPAGVECIESGAKFASNRAVPARGDLQVIGFKPFELEVGEYLCQNPQLFAKFRTDEVSTLLVRNGHIIGFTNDTWRHCTNLKQSLRTLELPDTESVSDESVDFLNELPNLVSLNIENTSFTGAGIAKLRRLKQLESLRAEGIRFPEIILNALQGNSKISDLAIRVSDRTAATLETLPNLKELILGNARQLSEKGLARIATLKSLQKLTIYDSPGASVSSLKPFSHLKELIVVVPAHERLASETDQKQLRQLLKDTKISILIER